MMNKKIRAFFCLRLSSRGLIGAALVVPGMILCLATLFGFLGKYGWFFDLFSHFRVQYLFSLTSLVLVCLVLRRWRSAGIYFVLALLNLMVCSAGLLGRSGPTCCHREDFSCDVV